MVQTSFSPVQHRDACLALTFLLLLGFCFWGGRELVYAALAVLLLGMVAPGTMRPFTFFWFGLSAVLGKYVSALLLGLVFLFLVLPVALFRWALGKDPLALRRWRASADSCFTVREHRFTAEDLQNPY